MTCFCLIFYIGFVAVFVIFLCCIFTPLGYFCTMKRTKFISLNMLSLVGLVQILCLFSMLLVNVRDFDVVPIYAETLDVSVLVIFAYVVENFVRKRNPKRLPKFRLTIIPKSIYLFIFIQDCGSLFLIFQ